LKGFAGWFPFIGSRCPGKHILHKHFFEKKPEKGREAAAPSNIKEIQKTSISSKRFSGWVLFIGRRFPGKHILHKE